MEIGERTGKIGEILKVKPLAALAMIDEGELDWKIVAISLDDPRASLLNDIDDVEKHFPVIFLFTMHLLISLHILYSIFCWKNLLAQEVGKEHGFRSSCMAWVFNYMK